MKIQLQSLRVLNCGPLRDVCIHFAEGGDSPTTVLAGANGSGKTTALKLILGLAELLAPSSELLAPTYELRPSRLDQLSLQYAQCDWLVEGQSFSTFYGQKPENVKLADDYCGRSGVSITKSERILGSLATTLREQIRFQESGPVPFSSYRLDLEEANYKPVSEQTLLPLPYPLPSVLLFDHTRLLPPVVGDQMSKEDLLYQWTYFYQIAREYKGSLDSYLVWLDYTDPDMFKDVIMFLNSLNFDGKAFGIRRRALKATVTTRGGDTHFLEALSSGEQNILIILLELRRRLLPGSVVLIDELENSLHPAFQHQIVNGLKRLQEMVPFQLIVTSHSPTILEAFGTQTARILTQF